MSRLCACVRGLVAFASLAGARLRLGKGPSCFGSGFSLRGVTERSSLHPMRCRALPFDGLRPTPEPPLPGAIGGVSVGEANVWAAPWRIDVSRRVMVSWP